MNKPAGVQTGTRLSRGRPTREAAQSLRREILQAASKLFLESGFATSMESIAAEARISKRTLYAHYPTKVSLFNATHSWLSGNLAQPASAIPSGAPLDEAILHFCDQLYRLYDQPKTIAFSRLARQEGERFPELAISYYRSFVDNIVTPFQHFLDGRVGRDLGAVDTAVLATTICAIAVAEMTRAHLPESDINIKSYNEYMRRAVGQILQGVAIPPR